MKTFIPINVHGALDYLGGALTMASPWIFGFAHLGGAPFFLPLFGGFLQLLTTVFTKHPTGIIKVVPLQLHLFIDVMLGFLLLVSPFLSRFYPFVVLPHVILGGYTFMSGIFTNGSAFLDKVDVLDSRGR